MKRGQWDSLDAAKIKTDVTNFDGLLSSADINVQLALDTLDNLSLAGSGISLDTTNFDGILSATEDNVQLAMDVLDDHNHASSVADYTVTGDLYVSGGGIDVGVADSENGFIWLYGDDGNFGGGIRFHTGADHDGVVDFWDLTVVGASDDLALWSDAGKYMIQFVDETSVELFYDGVKKFETATAGVAIGDGTATAATIGFVSDDLEIINNDPGGKFHVKAYSGTGSLKQLITADPEGAFIVYYAGDITFQTGAGSVVVYGAAGDNTVIGGENTESYFRSITTSNRVMLQAKNSAEANVNCFVGDPDGSADLYFASVKEAETISGGFKATNSFTIASTTNVTGILDEDDMASDSAVSLSTQQAIKAYVDGVHVTLVTSGFEDAALVALSSDGGTPPTITLTFTGTVYWWSDGVRYSGTGTDAIQINDTSGENWIYYDGDTLTTIANPTHSQIDSVIENKALVALVYWNTNSNTAPILADELHGMVMSGATHHWIHENVGARWDSGGTISGYTLNTSSDAAIVFDLTNIEFYDDDKLHNIIDGSAATQYSQVLTGDAEVPVLYRDAVDQTWVEAAASTLPYLVGGNTRIQYQDALNSYALTEVGSNQYCNYWVVLCNDWQYPVKMIPGTTVYTNAPAAAANAGDEVADLGDLPGPEFVILYKFLMHHSAGGTKNAEIISITDYRSQTVKGVAAGSATSHAALSGLNLDDHAQYVLADGTRDITLASGTFSILGSGETLATFTDDGSVDLYYDGTKEAETVSGALKATNAFQIAASGLTMDSIIDDDTMATATATSFSTSESIKAYVDGLSDKIEEGNSKVEVIDTGTGRVEITLDGTLYYSFLKQQGVGFGSAFIMPLVGGPEAYHYFGTDTTTDLTWRSGRNASEYRIEENLSGTWYNRFKIEGDPTGAGAIHLSPHNADDVYIDLGKPGAEELFHAVVKNSEIKLVDDGSGVMTVVIDGNERANFKDATQVIGDAADTRLALDKSSNYYEIHAGEGGGGASEAWHDLTEYGLTVNGQDIFYTTDSELILFFDQLSVTSAGIQLTDGVRVDNIETTLTDDDTHLPTSGAVADYVAAQFAANDAMTYKGVIDASTNPNYPAGDAGDTYKISVAGKIGGASGEPVEVGDMAICLVDSSASGDQAAVGANWNIIQVNIDGAVVGPASSTDHAIARFDLATGKLIQNSLVTIDDSGSVDIPTGQAYKINNVALAATDVGAAPSSHGNANHSSTFIIAGDVTYTNLNANGDVGTGATQVAFGNHGHAQLHDRSHAVTGTSDHTATNWRLFHSNGAGQVVEIALGADNTYLKSAGASAAPGFEALDISEDTSPTLGGDLVLDESSIKYVPASLADTTAEGEVATMTIDAGAAVAFGDLLFMAADFELEQTDADTAATMPAIAMSLGTGEGSQDVFLKGFVRNDAWGWSAGPIYVSGATGLMTQTEPAGSGDQVQRVGWAYSADVMFFDPDSTVIEIA